MIEAEKVYYTVSRMCDLLVSRSGLYKWRKYRGEIVKTCGSGFSGDLRSGLLIAV